MMRESESSGQIHVLIADDHNLILEIIAMALENTPDIRLTTALSVEGAVAQLRSHGSFDLILLDLDMPGMMGAETLSEMALLNGGRPVGIITGHPGPQIVAELRRSGAVGVVPKTSSMRSLIGAIRLMAGGEQYFPTECATGPEQRPEPAPPRLMGREIPILQKLVHGLSDAEIGVELALAEATVKMHVRSICRKLAADERKDVAFAAKARGLI